MTVEQVCKQVNSYCKRYHIYRDLKEELLSEAYLAFAEHGDYKSISRAICNFAKKEKRYQGKRKELYDTDI